MKNRIIYPEHAALHDKYVVVPTDKTSNNILFVCKTHYISCLRQELGLNTSEGNSIYTCTLLSKGGILSNHKTVLLSFVMSTVDEDLGLPKTYWIPKLHKDP